MQAVRLESEQFCVRRRASGPRLRQWAAPRERATNSAYHRGPSASTRYSEACLLTFARSLGGAHVPAGDALEVANTPTMQSSGAEAWRSKRNAFPRVNRRDRFIDPSRHPSTGNKEPTRQKALVAVLIFLSPITVHGACLPARISRSRENSAGRRCAAEPYAFRRSIALHVPLHAKRWRGESRR